MITHEKEKNKIRFAKIMRFLVEIIGLVGIYLLGYYWAVGASLISITFILTSVTLNLILFTGWVSSVKAHDTLMKSIFHEKDASEKEELK